MHRGWQLAFSFFLCIAPASAWAQSFQHTDIDYDEQWIQFFGSVGIGGAQEEEVFFRINSWRNLVDDGNRLSDPKLKNDAIEKLFANQVSWVQGLPGKFRVVAERNLNTTDFRGSPVDTYIKTTLKKVLREIVGGPVRQNSSRDEFDVAARRAAQRYEEYQKHMSLALNKVVSPRHPQERLDTRGRLRPASRFVNTEVRVTYFARVSGKLHNLTGKEWISQIYSDLGRTNIERFILQQGMTGDVDSRYLVLLDYIDQNFRFAENTEEPQQNPNRTSRVSEDEHGHYINGTAVNVNENGLSPRLNSLQQEQLKPIFDKCIACHAMPTGDLSKNLVSSKLITYKTLMHAMRSGEYGTFQKKILPMMSNANTVHIHFNPNEIAAIGEVYRRTKEDENLPDVPHPQLEPKSREELNYPASSRRAIALQNEFIFAATLRCLVCHKDPDTEGAENVNTLSKLRAAMRTISADTINAMIDKGYQHDRLIHIQDLKNVEGRDIPLKTMLLNFAKLPKDFPNSSP